MKYLQKKIIQKSLNVIYAFGLIYLLFQIERVVFYIANYKSFSDVTLSDMISYMISGAIFDSSAIVYTNMLFAVLYLLPHPLHSKIWYARIVKSVFVLFNSIALLPSIIDMEYYKYTLRRTTFDFFQEFKNETILSKLFSALAIDYWYYTLLWISMITLLIWLAKKRKITYVLKNNIYDYGYHTLLMLIVTGLIIIGARGGWAESTRPITMNDAGQYCREAKHVDLVLNTTFSIYKTIESYSVKAKSFYTDKKMLAQYFNPIHRPQPTAPFKNKNIVILVLESYGGEITGYLNEDLRKKYNYTGFTPFLDSLSKKSLTFMNGYANGRKSIDALPCIVASLPKIYQPYISSSHYSNTLESLSSCLLKKKYTTSFFHGAPNGSMGFWGFLRPNGFEQYYGKDEFNNDDEYDGIWGIWDEPFLQFMGDKLNEHQQPFLSVFFSVSSHTPYILPKKYQGVFPEGKHPLHKCVRYTDSSLQQFFEQVSQTEWYKNTLFIICADHCQGGPLFEEYMTYHGLFHIPILIFDPSGEIVAKQEEKVFSQLDIMPTVLDYLNYDMPYYSVGKSYFSDEKNYIYNNRNHTHFYLWDEEHLLFYDEIKDAFVEFYNIKKDPLLKNNLIDTPSAKKEEMKKYLKAFLQEQIDNILQNTMTAKNYLKKD